jgi:hypothetical protein
LLAGRGRGEGPALEIIRGRGRGEAMPPVRSYQGPSDREQTEGGEEESRPSGE